MDHEQIPDIYADSVSVTAGPYGVAVTFLLTDPPLGDEEARSPYPVGRVRMSPALARALREALERAGGDGATGMGATPAASGE